MDSTKRFSNRVDDYVKYRPGYPVKIVTDLAASGIFQPRKTVMADIGSGTGLFARMFLEQGNQVYGIEPNAEMRAAGDDFLGEYPNFQSVEGTAERTGLPAESVGLVTAAQAFHWFDVPRAKEEFRRILKKGGWVALVWNERKVETSPFLVEYERLLKTHSADYAKVDHRRVTEGQMRDFLGGDMRTWTYDNEQVFDYDGLKGRLLSSSYAPREGMSGFESMIGGLRGAFDRFNVGGKVAFEYDTKVYAGMLGA